MSTRIHIVVPDELLARVDRERGLIQRSPYLVALIENALLAAPLVKAPPIEAEQAARTVPAPEPPRRVPPPAQGWTAPRRT